VRRCSSRARLPPRPPTPLPARPSRLSSSRRPPLS